MADGITYHDESFAAAMTRNVARTSGKDKQVRAIKRLVSAQEKEQAAKQPPKPKGSLRLRELDKTRRVESMHIGRHSIFEKEDAQGNEVFTEMPFDFGSYTYDEAYELATELAERSGKTFEIRDGDDGGRVVNIIAPPAGPAPPEPERPAISPALEDARRREAVYMASKGQPFVAFTGDSAAVWDYHSDYDAMLVRAQDEADLYNEIVEIRDGNEGGAVRRIVEKRA
jgi:hypothetical protein